MENKKAAQVCSYQFSFGRAIFAGFLGALLILVLIYLQGHNPALSMGKVILGSDAMPLFMYLLGGACCLLIGLLFALFYALILAPMRFMSDFAQGIIFAGIMTAISIFTFPRLQNIVDAILKGDSEVALVQKKEEKTEVAITEEMHEEKGEKEEMKNMILYNFMNHLIYALAVIVVYRQCKE